MIDNSPKCPFSVHSTLLRKYIFMFYFKFQNEIMRESSDLLTLGLLFGEDVDATSSDLPEVLSFQHKLIHEMVAAYYIAEQVKTNPSFLKTAFPTWGEVRKHREVVKFTCGLLAQNAGPVINYVGKMNYNRQRHTIGMSSMESEDTDYDTDDDTDDTDEPAVIQDLDIKNPHEFLATAYPTSEKILKHKDKLRFICELLLESYADATPLVNHVAQVRVREIWEELNRGEILSEICGFRFMNAMQTLQNEGKVSNVNPYLCWYSEFCGGLLLAEVFNNTKLAVIAGVAGNDPLNVKHSTADVILILQEKNKETCSKLVKALHSAQANLLALHLSGRDIHEDVMEELEAYMGFLGPHAQLMYCYLQPAPITSSMLTSLSKCKQLRLLNMAECDLGSRLHILLSDPPPQLRVLVLYGTKLCAEDVDQIADCVRHNKLPHLRKLYISNNRVGEAAVRCLLEAFLTTRRQSEQLGDHITNVRNEYTPHAPSHKGKMHSDQDKVNNINNMKECCDDVSGDEDEEDEKLELDLRRTAAVGENEDYKDLSDEFIEEWKHKLKNTDIEVDWS